MSDPNRILDQLRNSLAYSAPELADTYWRRAETELASALAERARTSKLLTGTAFVGGAAGSLYLLKFFPKSAVARHFKWAAAVIKAWKRLQKAVHEEYYHIDELIETEQTFIEMVKPKHMADVVTSFYVKDDGQDRGIGVSIKNTKKDKDGKDGGND